MIVSNKNHPHTIKNIEEPIAYIKKEKATLPTMRSSLAKFNPYPEMNGGPSITESLSDQVTALELDLASRPSPPMTTTYNPPVQMSIWDLPLNITTTTVPVSATTKSISYKLAVQNQCIHTNQPKSKINVNKAAKTTPSPQQRQHQQQNQVQDPDKMDTNSTKSEISELSVSLTIQTLATTVSAMTEVVEGMKSVLKATNDDKKKREKKATKLRIQREKVNEQDRADERKEDTKEAKTIRSKNKAEAEERIKVE